MTLLETYLQTLWDFLQAARRGTVSNMPHEEDTQLSYLWLSVSGTWEITTTSPDMLASTSATGIVIPLVLPLSPIILAAHVETQWALNQPAVYERHTSDGNIERNSYVKTHQRGSIGSREGRSPGGRARSGRGKLRHSY